MSEVEWKSDESQIVCLRESYEEMVRERIRKRGSCGLREPLFDKESKPFQLGLRVREFYWRVRSWFGR